jgi:hypothetical protein
MDIEFEYSQFCHPGIRSERKTNKYERHLKNIFIDVHVGMIEHSRIKYGQNPLKDLDSRVFTRMLCGKNLTL